MFVQRTQFRCKHCQLVLHFMILGALELWCVSLVIYRFPLLTFKVRDMHFEGQAAYRGLFLTISIVNHGKAEEAVYVLDQRFQGWKVTSRWWEWWPLSVPCPLLNECAVPLERPSITALDSATSPQSSHRNNQLIFCTPFGMDNSPNSIIPWWRARDMTGCPTDHPASLQSQVDWYLSPGFLGPAPWRAASPTLAAKGSRKGLLWAEGGKQTDVPSPGSLGWRAVATSKPLKVWAAVCCF